MGITLYSLGATQEVTGSKHIVEVNGRSIMIDCGAFQGKRKEADEKNRNFKFPTQELDAVVLTHAHYDHCGLLPLLVKQGYEGNIYSTPATRDLANLVLMDSARIQARDAEYLRKQAAKKGEKFSWKPIFNEFDCTKAANQIVTVSYNRKMYITPDVQLEFFDAGHILGSSCVLLSVKGLHYGTFSAPSPARGGSGNEVRILYTGDLGRNNKPIVRDPSIDIPAPDYVYLESTYGNRKHENKEYALDELERVVRRAVEKKGKIIIPSFAIERCQELVYYLHLFVDKGRIPKIPIYVDSPMAASATGIFSMHPECYDEETKEAFLKHHKNPFGFGSLSFINSVDESKELNKKEGPMIIISADGMCEAGRVLYHLANGISDPRNTVLIVGYMAEDTLGRKLFEGSKEVKILGDWYKVNAEVESINAFSAHADYEEIVEWLDALDTSRLKQIFLVHGETDSQEYLQNYLAEHGYPQVTVSKYNERYRIE
ncbi:MAG: MBL fold metallo-hydrolase [Treponema sp.]|nr:MBL fold metallo-hydrolase [Treponema sp.]